MKITICYNATKLVQLLNNFTVPNYELKRLPVTQVYMAGTKESERYYIAREDVKSVKLYEGYWTSMSIEFIDGTSIEALSDNVNTDDKLAFRISNNSFICPQLIVTNNYVEATAELNNWLQHRGMDLRYLDDITETFTYYETIKYPGVPTPEYVNGSWSYCQTTPLTLTEQEIDTVLGNIADKVLAKKIECILYARIFKK